MATESGNKTAAEHAENDPVGKGSAKFLDEIEDKAALIPKRSVDKPEIRVQAGPNDSPPHLAIKDAVGIVQALIDHIDGLSGDPF